MVVRPPAVLGVGGRPDKKLIGKFPVNYETTLAAACEIVNTGGQFLSYTELTPGPAVFIVTGRSSQLTTLREPSEKRVT